MKNFRRIVLFTVLIVFCVFLLTGCKKEQKNHINRIPKFHGSALDFLLENSPVLEQFVQLFMDHQEAFLLYDSPYSHHKDFTLEWYRYDYDPSNYWTCFSPAEREFVLKCKYDLSIDNVTLYEYADTYLTIRLSFYVDTAPVDLYWIDLPEDGIDQDKMQETTFWVLHPYVDGCTFMNVLGNNWYVRKGPEN